MAVWFKEDNAYKAFSTALETNTIPDHSEHLVYAKPSIILPTWSSIIFLICP